MAWTKRTKETDTWTKGEKPTSGIAFDNVGIFWDREDIYFDNDTAWTGRTKETDTWTKRTKPTDTWTKRTKETDTWTERTKETD